MEKLSLIMFLCLVTSFSPVNACDSCACSTSSMGMGLMTNFKSKFIRFAYFDTRFETKPEHNQKSMDVFLRSELAFRFVLLQNPRWRLSGQLPFVSNSRKDDHEVVRISGLGDIQLGTTYVLIDDKKMGEKTHLYFEVGLGLSFANASYSDDLHDLNLPQNFNLGRGAIGLTLQSNAILNLQDFGLAISANYLAPSRAKNRYQFGAQFSCGLSIFKEWSLGERFLLIPNMSLNYEHIAQDVYIHGSRKEVSGTGGRASFLSPSISLKMDRVLLAVTYSSPLRAYYSEGEVDALGRLACQVSYIF